MGLFISMNRFCIIYNAQARDSREKGSIRFGKEEEPNPINHGRKHARDVAQIRSHAIHPPSLSLPKDGALLWK